LQHGTVCAVFAMHLELKEGGRAKSGARAGQVLLVGTVTHK